MKVYQKNIVFQVTLVSLRPHFSRTDARQSAKHAVGGFSKCF